MPPRGIAVLMKAMKTSTTTASSGSRDLRTEAALLRINADRRSRRTPSGRWVAPAVLLVAAVAGGWWLTGSQVLTVQTTTVTTRTPGAADQTVLTASGYVTARRRATVSSKVMGKLIEVLVEGAHPETEHLFDAAMIAKMKRGAYLVNTARGKIANRDAVAEALESGQLAGYAGDVWFPQPAPRSHPWRTMPNHGMTPHISGTSLSAQARYAAGTREILECFLEGRPIRDEYLIVEGGHLAGTGAHSYSPGNATKGSEEAEEFKADA